MTIRRYMLALDESGQPHIRDPRGCRYGFVEGGLVIRSDKVDKLGERLDAFKAVFLGETREEAKSHEIARAMGAVGDISEFEHALAHISIAFRDCGAFLAGAFLDKSCFFGPPDGALIEARSRGGVKVNQWLLFETVALAFGLFLGRNDARGDILHDQLGGQSEQSLWLEAFDVIDEQHRDERGRIDSLTFVDSRDSKLVQMADVAIGLLRHHFETRSLLRDGAVGLASEATRHGLLINVQP